MSKFRASIEQRKKFSALFAQINASNRATAQAIGVDPETVRRDRGAANAAESKRKSKEPAPKPEEPAAFAAPETRSAEAVFLSAPTDPNELAKKQVAKEQKRAARESANEAGMSLCHHSF